MQFMPPTDPTHFPGDIADDPKALAAVKRALKSEGVDADRALLVLIATLVVRHIEWTRRHMKGARGLPPWSPGNERLNALTAAMDALHQCNATDTQAMGGRAFDTSPIPGVPGKDARNVRRLLMRLLAECQFIGEAKLGLDKDDDDDPPTHMRLVRD